MTTTSRREPSGHVLIVAYWFPPVRGGGIPRPVKMAKYLQRMGWRVTVLTIEADGAEDPGLSVAPARVVRVRERDMRPALRTTASALRGVRQMWEKATRPGAGGAADADLIDLGFAEDESEIEASKIGWVTPAVKAALRIHDADPVDVAVVSLPPASSGTVGWFLNRLRKVPYVVEYRDPWTVGAFWTSDANGRRRADPATRTRYAATRKLEETLLRGAAAAVIVNGSRNVERLRASFPAAMRGKPAVQIRNGVDLEDIPAPPASRATGRLRVLHAGFFYYFHSPHHVIKAMRQIQETDPGVLKDVEFEFMGGGFPDALLKASEEWGIRDNLVVTSSRPYSESLRSMSEADGLLVVLPPLESYRDCIPTKIYEYLGTGHPVLAVVAKDGAVARLLEDVPNARVADNADPDALATGITEYLALLRQGEPSRTPDDEAPGAEHHYLHRAEELHELLGSVLTRNKNGNRGETS